VCGDPLIFCKISSDEHFTFLGVLDIDEGLGLYLRS